MKSGLWIETGSKVAPQSEHHDREKAIEHGCCCQCWLSPDLGLWGGGALGALAFPFVATLGTFSAALGGRGREAVGAVEVVQAHRGPTGREVLLLESSLLISMASFTAKPASDQGAMENKHVAAFLQSELIGELCGCAQHTYKEV